MELLDLATFISVARCGGITRAAGELNTVQSNVTNRIKALEAEVGVPLFERHSRGMTLTSAGRRLVPYAERLAAMSREAIGAARDDGVPKGPLAIGSMETTAAVRLPPLLTRFHQRFPAVQLSLRTGPTAALVDAVLDSSLDGAFVSGPIDHPGLVSSLAFQEELALVTAKCWQSFKALRAGTPASGPTILVFRAGCSYRQRLEQVLAEFGWPCATRLEFGTLDGIIGCVSANMGVTLLPRIVAERSELSGSVRTHRLKSSQSHVDTLFIKRRTVHQGSALQSFVDCLGSVQRESHTARRGEETMATAPKGRVMGQALRI
jgi:DNA-binding transcriptional LysR family regulator